MARPKKTFQPQVIGETQPTEDVEKFVETVEKQPAPTFLTLIPKDGNVVTRRAPTMDVKHIAGKLVSGCAYRVKKTVNSAIYGEFYLLESGLYVAKVGNFIIK